MKNHFRLLYDTIHGVQQIIAPETGPLPPMPWNDRVDCEVIGAIYIGRDSADGRVLIPSIEVITGLLPLPTATPAKLWLILVDTSLAYMNESQLRRAMQTIAQGARLCCGINGDNLPVSELRCIAVVSRRDQKPIHIPEGEVWRLSS